MSDGGTPEVESMEVEGSLPADRAVIPPADGQGAAAVDFVVGQQQDVDDEAMEPALDDDDEDEDVAEDLADEEDPDETLRDREVPLIPQQDDQDDEDMRGLSSDDTMDKQLAERAKSAGGDVTSFIVSTESTEVARAGARARLADGEGPNVVEAPGGDDDDDDRATGSWTAGREPPIAVPTEPRCTMRGVIGDLGQVDGRWGMTREALDDLSQTSAPSVLLVFVAWNLSNLSTGRASSTGARCRAGRARPLLRPRPTPRRRPRCSRALTAATSSCKFLGGPSRAR